MYNQTLIADRLAIIHNTVKRLKLLAEMSLQEFSHNEDAVDIAENRLRRAIEAIFDLGRYLVVKTGSGIPRDYRSVIEMLRELKILPDGFARQIEGLAGYRNRLIHDYNKVTPEEIHQILQTRLPDFNLFCQYIADYLQKSSDTE